MLEKGTSQVISSLRIAFYIVFILWIVHFLKTFLHLNLGVFGVYPRAVDGLKGIITSPFIHGSIQHLVSNSVPLFFLLFLISLSYKRIAYYSFFLIYIMTGIAVWLFARGHTYHIGASGVVYGLVAFVFWSGIFRRSPRSILLALLVLFMYSGYFLGIVPNQPHISWESHLFGGLVGIFVAFLFKNTIEVDDKKVDPWEEDTYESKTHVFPPDLFEKTMEERHP